MEWNEMDKKIIDKAHFFKINELIAHVLTIPKGTFKNGRFASELMEGKFFWFIENSVGIPIRLFLSEIYDIEEYTTKPEEAWK
jgi:hypothetical protein